MGDSGNFFLKKNASIKHTYRQQYFSLKNPPSPVAPHGPFYPCTICNALNRIAAITASGLCLSSKTARRAGMAAAQHFTALCPATPGRKYCFPQRSLWKRKAFALLGSRHQRSGVLAVVGAGFFTKHFGGLEQW